MRHIILPPIVNEVGQKLIPKYAEMLLICCIPEGRIAMEDTLLACLRKAYGNNNLKIQFRDYQCSFVDLQPNGYPNWRVVSKRGHLLGVKQLNRNSLESEGLTVIKHESKDQYVVQDYKSYLYDFSDLHITVLKSQEEMMSLLKEYMDNRPY